MTRVLAALLAVAATAHADDGRSARELVREARAAFAALRFPDTVHLLERAWHRGDSDHDELRDLFSLAGRAAAAMGDELGARLWFERWLCLDPAGELPAGASPKIAAQVAEARRDLGGRALAVRAVRTERGVELAIDDPLALVAAARIGDQRIPIASARGTVAAPRSEHEVALLDADGNILLHQPISDIAPGPVTTTAPSLAWYEHWWTWAIVTGGFTATALAMYWLEDDGSANDDGTRESIGRWGWRISLIGATAAAVTGVVVWLRTPNGQLVVAPQAGGASARWTLRF